MSSEDKFLDQSEGYLFLNSSDRSVLVYDLHAESGKLLREEFIGYTQLKFFRNFTIFVWQILQLLKSQIVDLHELHSGEWFYI